MIAGLAVRLERASPFVFIVFENFVRDGFEHAEAFLAGVRRLPERRERILKYGMRLDLVQALIYFFDARAKRSKIVRVAFLDDRSDPLG